jgi:hypothetical protein
MLFDSKGSKCLFSLFQEHVSLAFLEELDGIVRKLLSGKFGQSFSVRVTQPSAPQSLQNFLVS